MPKLSIEQLIDKKNLQIMQNAYSEFTGLATIITDAGGRQITNATNLSEICSGYIQNTSDGVKKCMECCVTSAYEATRLDGPCIYKCHAGLYCFTVPIMLDDILIGCFNSGQVICSDQDEQQVFRHLHDIGVDTDTCSRLIAGIRRMTMLEMRKAANFLYKLAKLFSASAYKTNILAMHSEMHNISPLINISDYISSLVSPISERLYKTREVFRSITENSEKICTEQNINFTMNIDEALPQFLLGDTALLQEGMENTVRYILGCDTSSHIIMDISCYNNNYACCLAIDIIAENMIVSDDIISEINNLIYTHGFSTPVHINGSQINESYLTDIFIKKLSGTIKLMNLKDKGTAVHITLPQLTYREENNVK